MKEIIILTDYKGNFGSKFNAVPYCSGLDKGLLETYFFKSNIQLKFMAFYDVDFRSDWTGKLVMYTSSEDKDLLYKSYIEDIIYGLELKGAIVVPKFKYLRAHHNKVFMEILRDELFKEDEFGSLNSLYFGTLEDAQTAIKQNRISFPCVLKISAGALSRGVGKADNASELFDLIKTMCRSFDFKKDTKEIIRQYKYRGYIKNSRYRRKFIVQPLIKGLENDWKVLFFGDHVYNLKRHVRRDDFRASGSHVNYKMGSESGLTNDMLNYVHSIFKKLIVPFASIDYAYDGKKHYILEFQTIYFGTSTQLLCKDYYTLENGVWVLNNKTQDIEEEFVNSVLKYLQENQL